MPDMPHDGTSGFRGRGLLRDQRRWGRIPVMARVPSPLLPAALARRAKVREAYPSWEAAARVSGPAGVNVTDNLRNESHHVGNPERLGAMAFAEFLQALLTSGGSPEDAFTGARQNHLLQGRVTRASASLVRRYFSLDTFEQLVNGVDGTDLETGEPGALTRFIVETWELGGRERAARGMLAPGPVVWVTFEGRDGWVRDRFSRGAEILDALGVEPLGGPETTPRLVELTYESAMDLQYPTTADGGWNPYFAAAPAGEPHGWTRPISVAGPGWPEAAHPNGSMGLVSERPDIIPS